MAILYRRFGTTYRSHLQGLRVQEENKAGTACQLSFLLELLTTENGTDTLSRNVGKGLPFDAA
jgi:hypothetical protein